jgi:hypothetical protein
MVNRILWSHFLKASIVQAKGIYGSDTFLFILKCILLFVLFIRQVLLI